MDQNEQSSNDELSDVKHQKSRIKKLLIFILTSFIAVISGLLIFLFFSPKSTQAQVESLVNLYFKVDHVRTDSAEIFAELLEIQRSPERIGSGTQEIEEKPYLSTREDLLKKITTNRKEVENVISIIQSEDFSSDEVKKVHIQLKEFYENLFEFEDRVVNGLEGIQSDKDLFIFVDDIFENEENFPEVLRKDEKLRDTLMTLAEKNNIQFTNTSYMEKYKERIIELDTVKLDYDRVGQGKHQFSIPENFSQANISVTIKSEGADITDLVFGLRHDDTGKVINFMISEIPPRDDAANTIQINNLPQRDIGENITANIIPSKSNPLFLNNFYNPNATVDYMDWWLMFTLHPDDPILSPVHGDWTLFVQGPGGIDLIIGSSHLTR